MKVLVHLIMIICITNHPYANQSSHATFFHWMTSPTMKGTKRPPLAIIPGLDTLETEIIGVSTDLSLKWDREESACMRFLVVHMALVKKKSGFISRSQPLHQSQLIR